MSDAKVVWSAERKTIQALVMQDLEGFWHELRGGLGPDTSSTRVPTKDEAIRRAQFALQERAADKDEAAERVASGWSLLCEVAGRRK